MKRVSLADRTAADRTVKATSAADATAGTAPEALWGEERVRREVVEIDIGQIMPNRRQPRTVFDQEALDQLADSIRTHGVLQPVLVRPIPLTKWEGHTCRYELIAGERRWRASLQAHLSTIPALIRADTSDYQTLIELALVENLQRADLHPLEEARAFAVMRDELGYSLRKLGEQIGRSKGYVENRLKLLDLGEDLQQLVRERPDTLMHVVELSKLTDPQVRAPLIAAVRDGLSYLETQARVQDREAVASLRKDRAAQPTEAGTRRAGRPPQKVLGTYRQGITRLTEHLDPEMDEPTRQATYQEVEHLMHALTTLLQRLQAG